MIFGTIKPGEYVRYVRNGTLHFDIPLNPSDIGLVVEQLENGNVRVLWSSDERTRVHHEDNLEAC